MDTRALQPEPAGAARERAAACRGSGTWRESRDSGVPLLMMAIVGTLAYEFQVTLPVIAKRHFHGDATTYGFLTAAMGVGAVVGGLVTATRGRTGLRPLTIAATVFGVAILFAALSPLLAVAFIAMAAIGWTSVAFLATGNSTLQLTARHPRCGDG